MGGSGLLYVPRSLCEDPLWQKPEWARAYLDLQMRACQEPAEITVGGRVVKLGRGELWVSVRRATDWWQMGQSAVRKFLHMLHDRGLIEYPDGRENARRRDSFRVRLVHYWGAEPGARVEAPYGPRTRQKPNGGPPAGDAERAPDQPAAKAPEPPPERKEEPPVHRLMKLLVNIGLGGVQLKGGMWSRQAAVIKRLCAEYGSEPVERAIRGMVRLWPYSNGTPFDAFKVEKRFAEALAAAGDDGGPLTESERDEQRARAQEAEVQRRLEHQARIEEWRALVSERLRGESREYKQELWRTALDQVEAMPIKPADKAGRERLARDIALSIYARRVGLPGKPMPLVP